MLVDLLGEDWLAALLAADEPEPAADRDAGDDGEHDDEDNDPGVNARARLQVDDFSLQAIAQDHRRVELLLLLRELCRRQVNLQVLGGAGEVVPCVGRAEAVLRASREPGIAIGSLDGHLVHLPSVVVASLGFRIGLVVPGGIFVAPGVVHRCVPLPEQAGVCVALVEARLLHEEALALRAQWAAAVPMVLRPVGLLHFLRTRDRLVRATRVVLPRLALGEAVGFGPGGVLVKIIQEAHIEVARQQAEVPRGRIIGVRLVPEPHREGLGFVLFVDKGIVPHVFAKLFAGRIDLVEALARRLCRVRGRGWRDEDRGDGKHRSRQRGHADHDKNQVLKM
mmetsp:Transcript_58844/g.167011  ORF Transcript_58844/g.167011 Transcript_58844/m.167011 type:complete len:337 (+) Transcript_58844:200-1210(+)